MRTFKYLLVVFLTFAAVWAASSLMPRPIPEPHLTQKTPIFDKTVAFSYLEELVTRYPERNYYHPDRLAAAAWLKEELESFGLEVFTQEFSVFVKDELYEGQKNIYAVSPGKQKTEEIILVVAHYDIPPFVHQGALDNGSGVATALELARIFAVTDHNRTIVFLMSDSEEYGAMWGAINFVKEFAQIDQVKAVLVLDMVNTGEMETIGVLPIGLQQGFTPLWLREKSLAVISRELSLLDPQKDMKAAADFPAAIDWVVRSIAINPTEAGVFLREGIPALHLYGVPKDQDFQDSVYHTEFDTIEHIQAESMERYGRSVESIIHSIDELSQIPKESMQYLKVGENNYLPMGAIKLIQLLLFIPLFFSVATGWWQVLRKGLSKKVLNGQLARLFTFFCSGLAGLFVLKLMPYTGLMVRYELYPATQKDPVLYNPQYLPIFVTIAVILGVGFTLWKMIGSRETLFGEDWETSHTLLLTVLALLIMLIFVVGKGFAAVSFFFLPAILWPLMGRGKWWGRRILNLFLVLAGFTVYAAFIYGFSMIFDIGVMWWYLMMAAAYGLFSWQALISVLAGLSLYLVGISLAWRSLPEKDN